MSFLYESVGILQASVDENGRYRMVLDVDPGIVEVARALVPRHVRLNKPKYAPHITLVREPELKPIWEQYHGENIPFTYDSMAYSGGVYWWLRAESPRLRAIRVELGLPEMAWYNYPPDLVDCYHITIGNTKETV